MIALLLAVALASHPDGNIDPDCLDQPDYPNYDEQTQQDFLANYVALATTFSAIHGPLPHKPGHGSVSLELAGIPPLSCKRRMVLGHSKTEDTNKTPLLPRPRVSFAFPKLGRFVPYAGLGYVPPVKIAGTTNVIVSSELGVGLPLEAWQLGARFHATLQKTSGEIATPFSDSQDSFLDLYLASTLGLDLLAGVELGAVTPYLSLGFTDVSTFFFVGDDNVVANNLHPYLGPVAAIGVDALHFERLRWGLELYGAPGGVSTPDPSVQTLSPASRYGRILTARLQIGLEL